MQLLTCKDVSVCKLSHMRTCLYATCHLISHVLSRLPRFHTNVSPTRRVHAHVRTLQDECLHTFRLTKTCFCVTFNIRHHLFHLTTHICSRNDVPPHDFNLRTLLCIQLLTHEKMSENIGFTDSKDSVHCKKTCLYATFWLTWSCACTRTQNFPVIHAYCLLSTVKVLSGSSFIRRWIKHVKCHLSRSKLSTEDTITLPKQYRVVSHLQYSYLQYLYSHYGAKALPMLSLSRKKPRLIVLLWLRQFGHNNRPWSFTSATSFLIGLFTYYVIRMRFLNYLCMKPKFSQISLTELAEAY